MKEAKEQIMAVALRLFAERGYDGVTVRDICTEAGTSIALINYHFRSKEGLYRECLDRIFTANDGLSLRGLDESVRNATTWKAAVRAWVFGNIRAIRSCEGGAALAAGFFGREVTRPSTLQGVVRERYVAPVKDCLVRLVAMAVADPDEATRWTESVWTQVVSYALIDKSWHDLFRPEGVAADAWGETYADFICRQIFSSLKFINAERKNKP